jgi:hypothetical protein
MMPALFAFTPGPNQFLYTTELGDRDKPEERTKSVQVYKQNGYDRQGAGRFWKSWEAGGRDWLDARDEVPVGKYDPPGRTIELAWSKAHASSER